MVVIALEKSAQSLTFHQAELKCWSSFWLLEFWNMPYLYFSGASTISLRRNTASSMCLSISATTCYSMAGELTWNPSPRTLRCPGNLPGEASSKCLGINKMVYELWTSLYTFALTWRPSSSSFWCAGSCLISLRPRSPTPRGSLAPNY
jgi:hypothetical protein